MCENAVIPSKQGSPRLETTGTMFSMAAWALHRHSRRYQFVAVATRLIEVTVHETPVWIRKNKIR